MSLNGGRGENWPAMFLSPLDFQKILPPTHEREMNGIGDFRVKTFFKVARWEPSGASDRTSHCPLVSWSLPEPLCFSLWQQPQQLPALAYSLICQVPKATLLSPSHFSPSRSSSSAPHPLSAWQPGDSLSLLVPPLCVGMGVLVRSRAGGMCAGLDFLTHVSDVRV